LIFLKLSSRFNEGFKIPSILLGSGREIIIMSNNYQSGINVVCPECGTAKLFYPPERYRANSEGLTSLNIPASAICEHSFQILVDRNNIVRGYSKADFEILTQADTLNTGNNLPLSRIFGNMNNTVAAMLIEAFFTLTPTILVGIENDDKSDLAQLYRDLIPYAEEFVILVDNADYIRIWKNRIYSSEYINSCVFDVTKGIVIKSNFKATKFSESIWSEIMGKKNDSVQKVVLKNWLDRITKYMDVVEKLVRKQPGIKKKEIIKYLTRLHDYNPKLVPFEIIIKRLIHIDETTFRHYL
jgi:hypothetical protein